MKSYLHRLFGIESRPKVIETDKLRLEALRRSILIPSESEPEALSDIEPDEVEYGIAEGQTFGIIYENAKGEVSERYITVWSIEPGPQCLLLKARCNLRNSQRSFRVDRIDSIFDYNGEVHPVNSFLHETFGIELKHLKSYKPPQEGSQFDSFPKVRKHVKTEAILLAGLSLSDGVFCDAEAEIGTRRLNSILEKQGFLLSPQGYTALSRYFSRMRPGEQEIDLALMEISQLPPDRQVSFITAGLDIIKADNVVTADEQTMWSSFVEDLTGLTLN